MPGTKLNGATRVETPEADEIGPGDVFWAQLGPVVGREQTGRRPVVVVSGRGHLLAATTLCTVVPVTSVDRGWPNHVFLDAAGLDHPSWAMTEQIRTISRGRLRHRAGAVTPAILVEIRMWMKDFLQLH
ncbi:MAG TPA: type II toxin-antitoxin system PemK/MazF family toxin [Beutenbergiaceae bacterium]|nr:type II toxin-antitoxin system PemK/MazF family toxin [Beutenbergiaceae bacterium]